MVTMKTLITILVVVYLAILGISYAVEGDILIAIIHAEGLMALLCVPMLLLTITGGKATGD